ncbi:MAG: glycogen debranching protein GlgX, partial [Umezawaea sp.]
KQMPGVREDLRGTYAGLACETAIAHLKELGVTAVELLPVHHIIDEAFLHERGLSNYWGYSSIGFFAPHDLYAAMPDQANQVQEFKGMVRALHEANIEVILDVVYNHTAEGNHLGPTLSMRGIDNEAYYRLVEDDKQFYMDYTGTGNSLNVRSPHTLQLIMDSLRYWVTEMHVDGFRFDLAATLAREFYDVDRLSTFFDLVQQDPVVSQVKLIAEPWDVGPGGYQVGNFPPLWTEWNGKYRDTVRDFWRGEPATLGEFASRITGSSDLYKDDGRRPYASINFVTAHDGFTLNDLVSYNDKHNEANGEDGRDGADDNRSWNCGVEGPTDEPEVLELRARQRRNLLATTLLSQGVPMLLHGDEFGRTQQGNNNVYCQDSEIAWVDWKLAEENADLIEFTGALTAFRKQHPVLRRRRFFAGKPIRSGDDLRDIAWFTPAGEEMTEHNWGDDFGRCVVAFLNGEGIPDLDQRGMRVVDDSFLLAFNAHHEDIEVTLPEESYGPQWTVVVDTATGEVRIPELGEPIPAGGRLTLVARSLVVLQRTAAE